MHLVGFIIRIYHDAWSPERQNTCIALSFINFGAIIEPTNKKKKEG